MGLHMLPNLKFLVCGILFCVLLFAVTGAGVMLPDSRTHIGEMPEIGRPMMQRSMADVPAQAQVYMATAARRNDELERLRAPSGAGHAAAQLEPDVAKPDLLKSEISGSETPKSDTSRSDLSKSDLSRPDVSQPDVEATAASDGVKAANQTADEMPGGVGVAAVRVSPASPVPGVDTRHGEQTDEAGPSRQVAALAPVAAGENEPAPRLANVPLPTPRPAVFNGVHRLARISYRRRHSMQQHDTAVPGVAAGQAVPAGHSGAASPGFAAGYAAPDAANRSSR
jgi:hypothetical protein